MERSNWQILLDVLIQRSQSRLHNIKNTDPISFCLDNRDIREILTKYINDFLEFQRNNKKLKNSEISEEKRKRGNEYFSSKNFEKCLESYTESVFHAPRNEECLALAYANRSSVLFRLSKYEECLQDIESALNHGYPPNNSAKLLLRMGKCLTGQGKILAAEALFKETLNNINHKCRDNLEFYTKQLKQEILKVSKMEDRSVIDYELPEPKDGENIHFVSASDSLTVVYSKTKGRHVRARRDVKIGDVLFVEKPFASVTLVKDACENCSAETVAPIPCWDCLAVKYCSEICRDKDQIHKYECGFGEFLKSVGIAHLALRVPLTAAPTFNQFKKVLKKIRTEQMPEDGSTVELKASGYENVYNLVTNMSSLEAKDLFQYALTASLLSLYVEQHTNYFSVHDEKNLKRFASVVLRHICQLVSNGHAITSVRNVDDGDKRLVACQIEERIGTAIYPSASMMNHSCDPSIVNSFHKNILIVRASKDIKKGEEVFNCYGPHCRRMKRAERQDVLFSQYRFRCNCSACTSAIDIQDIYTALRCQNCKGPSVRLSTGAAELVEALQKNSAGGDSEKSLQYSICISCGHYANIPKEITRKEIEIEDLLCEGQNLLSADENTTLALRKLLKSWKLGRQILYKFHRNLNLAADSVARCLLLLGEHRRCIMFLRCTVLSVEAQFGTTSIELATELKKFADSVKFYLSSNTIRDNEKDSRALAGEAVVAYHRAKAIYLLLCCANHPSLSEIESSLNFLESYIY